MINNKPKTSPLDGSAGPSMDQQQMPSGPIPREVNQMIDAADRDAGMYIGNPMIAGQRSFRRAVSGIEDGDYQGLEQLDFGSIDGTPAVAFIDEDGQRQTFRLTMPQWTAALETRSRARKQLEQEYKTDALKRALRPQYDMLLKNVPGADDPVAQSGWKELFELDPDTAYALAGGALRKDGKMDVLYGREQPEGFVKATNAMLDQQYKQKLNQFRVLDSGTVDIATKGGLAAAQAMIRPPEASHLPLEMTPSDWLAVNNATSLPMVNLIQQASMPLGLPGMDKPIVAPAPDMDGNYRESTVRNWLGQFNASVVQPLGWMPYDFDNPVHQQQVIEMLNAYNSNRTGAITRGGVQPTVQARPQASRDFGVMGQEEAQQPANKAMMSAEQFFERYKEYASEFPNTYGNTTEDQVRALLDAHEANVKLQAEGKAPKKYPPPQELADFYKAVTGG